MRKSKIKLKGFIFGSLSIFMLAFLLIALISVQRIEKELNNAELRKIEIKYIIENAAELQYRLIKNKLGNLPELTVLYTEAQTPDGKIVTAPIESSKLFEDEEKELRDLSSEAEDMLSQLEAHSPEAYGIKIQTEVLHDEFETLKLYLLDKEGAFENIAELGGRHSLSPVKFKSVVAHQAGSAEIVFSVNNLFFDVLEVNRQSGNPYGAVTVQLIAAAAEFEKISYTHN